MMELRLRIRLRRRRSVVLTPFTMAAVAIVIGEADARIGAIAWAEAATAPNAGIPLVIPLRPQWQVVSPLLRDSIEETGVVAVYPASIATTLAATSSPDSKGNWDINESPLARFERDGAAAPSSSEVSGVGAAVLADASQAPSSSLGDLSLMIGTAAAATFASPDSASELLFAADPEASSLFQAQVGLRADPNPAPSIDPDEAIVTTPESSPLWIALFGTAAVWLRNRVRVSRRSSLPTPTISS